MGWRGCGTTTSTTKDTRWTRRRTTCSPPRLKPRAQRAIAANITAREPFAELPLAFLSGKLQAPQLDPVRANLSEIMVCLLREPAFGAATENFGQPHGHNWWNSALAV